MLYEIVSIIDYVNQHTYIYYVKDYKTACKLISRKKRELQHDMKVEGEDYTILHCSGIEFSDIFIEEECINIQPGVYFYPRALPASLRVN